MTAVKERNRLLGDLVEAIGTEIKTDKIAQSALTRVSAAIANRSMTPSKEVTETVVSCPLMMKQTTRDVIASARVDSAWVDRVSCVFIARDLKEVAVAIAASHAPDARSSVLLIPPDFISRNKATRDALRAAREAIPGFVVYDSRSDDIGIEVGRLKRDGQREVLYRGDDKVLLLTCALVKSGYYQTLADTIWMNLTGLAIKADLGQVGMSCYYALRDSLPSVSLPPPSIVRSTLAWMNDLAQLLPLLADVSIPDSHKWEEMLAFAGAFTAKSKILAAASFISDAQGVDLLAVRSWAEAMLTQVLLELKSGEDVAACFEGLAKGISTDDLLLGSDLEQNL